MKKCLKLFILFLLLMPTIVFAKDKVNVYVFRGEGCPHCEELKDYLDGLDSETKSKFEVKDFEVWYNKDNSKLMDEIAELRNEKDRAIAVPYIIIGDKSWIGFDESTMGSEIKSQIESVYIENEDKRYDVMDLYEDMEDDKYDDDQDYDNDDDFILEDDIILDDELEDIDKGVLTVIFIITLAGQILIPIIAVVITLLVLKASKKKKGKN